MESQPRWVYLENFQVLKAIRDYNIDDCNSTQELTEWLRSEQFSHNIKYTRSLDKEEERKQ